MSNHAQQVYSLIQRLMPLYRFLEPYRQEPLSTSQRKALCAILSDRASDLVHATAEALSSSAELFPDIPIDPAALADCQDDADALTELRAHLLVLLRLTLDATLLTQSTALDAAHKALKRVRQDDEIVFNQDRRRPFRALAMAVAQSYYSPKHRAVRGRRTKGRARTPR